MPRDLTVDVVADDILDLGQRATEVVAVPVEEFLALFDHDHLPNGFLRAYLLEKPPKPQPADDDVASSLLDPASLRYHF